MKYIVKSIVCDYGVYERTDFNNKEELIVICNLKSNAELIANILNTDLKNERYEVVKKSKVDKAIEEMERDSISADYEDKKEISKAIDKYIEILKRNIGE